LQVCFKLGDLSENLTVTFGTKLEFNTTSI